jgi:hypothetical protein
VCELDVPAASTAGDDLATVVQAFGPGAGTEAGTESPLPPLLIGLRLSLMLDNLTLQPATLLRLRTLAREFESSKPVRAATLLRRVRYPSASAGAVSVRTVGAKRYGRRDPRSGRTNRHAFGTTRVRKLFLPPRKPSIA